eukprot:10685678-Alexandrium_andersonii.AAC.1
MAGWQHRQGMVGLASVGRGRSRHGSACRGAQRRLATAQRVDCVERWCHGLRCSGHRSAHSNRRQHKG